VFLIVVSALIVQRWPAVTNGISLRRQTKVRPLANLVILLIALAGASVYLQSVPRVQLHQAPVVDLSYPEQGAQLIRSNYSEARIFNAYEWGGYLIHELYPQKVFVDGRSDFYGDALLRDYDDVLNARENWRQILDEHRVNLIIVYPNSPLAEHLRDDPEWTHAITGPVEVVFLREMGRR
jgi:hypothetical protein